MTKEQKRYFASVRIEELQRCIDTILGKKKGTHTKQDVSVLADARKIYLARMGVKYR